MTPACSIIIRAFNEERHIGRLLTGIAGQTVRDVQVILVDSGSTDATVEIARRHPVEVVTINPHEFTFGRSLNLGIAQARAEVVVLASAHVYPVYPDWLEHLLAGFEDPKTALVYGRQSGAPTTHYSEQRIFHHWYPDQSIRRQPTPFCNNANAAIRRSLWAEHPYDESLTGLEDLAWAKVMVGRGHRVCYQGEASVVHVHQERWRQVMNRYRREAIALKRIAPEEDFAFGDFLSCLARNVWSDLRHAHREARLSEVWREVFLFRLMQFWGTWRGFAGPGAIPDNLKRTFYYPKGWDHEPDIDRDEGRAKLRIPYAALADDDD